jgi:hypothetical protein
MPINRRIDSEGCYYQYGNTGAKYHYECGNEAARQRAYDKARAQEIVIGKFDLAESYTDYPEAVKEAAARGIRLNEEVNNKCATQVGKVRAQQLAKGEPISLETIKRMYSYLSRAKEYYNPDDDKACGTISYLLWGGPEALGWSERKLDELENEVNTSKPLTFMERLRKIINK